MDDLESLLAQYRQNISSFSENELAEISSFFSAVFGKRFISSKEDAFDIILEQGLVKAINKLPADARLEFKKKILAL